ncbi:MAG: RNase J family beta-CASP ribonuclease [Candidatus Woesearchaeota archaeon]
MPVEICTVGGYGEVGRNMTAIRIDDEVIICDMGVHLENYIALTEEEDVVNISPKQLIYHKAVPDITVIESWKPLVKAIVPTHAHLDHIGAVPFLAPAFDAPVICTPFTAAVLHAIIDDAGIQFPNKIKVLNANSSIKISDAISIEFVSITHSTPQTVIVVIHTPYGDIIYANDFKFDNTPIVGTKPNMERLREIGATGKVLCLIVDSLYADEHKKMPSESVAREMLKDVMLNTESQGKGMIVTTFSSHIARLKSILEFGKKLNRKVIFLGRSMNKYITAAESVGLVNFSEEGEIIKYASRVGSKIKKICNEGKDKYLLVVTGHQGEPKSALSKMAHGLFPFEQGDIVIFSTSVIPSPTNIKNREIIEDVLRTHGARIFRDIHISGHAAREDHRDLLTMLKPRHLLPSHAPLPKMTAMLELAIDMGMPNDTVHLVKEGTFLELK